MAADPVAAGRKGGKSRSEKKLAAARRNGFQRVYLEKMITETEQHIREVGKDPVAEKWLRDAQVVLKSNPETDGPIVGVLIVPKVEE
jgi:hypothetical protein